MNGPDARAIAQRLGASGNPDARVDARWMLEASHDPDVLERWIERRLSGEPLQYILSEAHFYGYKLYVDARVLIPRQDTETLCEAALQRIKPGALVLDLCTGSGALAVAIKKRCPSAKLTATDISEGALDVARRNAREHALDIEFAQGDLFEAVKARRFDVIVCNPPYLSDRDMDNLQTEVQSEPPLALHGGADGLDFYRRIAREASAHLSDGGTILLEVGMGQARQVAALFTGETQIVNDINAIERVVIWTYSK